MITIVGGTYIEVCLEPHFRETFGSGLRACKVMLSLDPSLQLDFHTFIQKDLISYLNSYSDIYKNFNSYHNIIDKNMLFYYDYPLSYPHIFPRLDKINKSSNLIIAEGDNVLMYGFIEGESKVNGKLVVYDPQSPVNPKSFHSSGSTAEKLTIVLNFTEAEALSNSNSLEDILKYFFEIEKVDILILKQGAKGANVYNRNKESLNIPVYRTDAVWNIGSGDVFVASYAYYWFNGCNEFEAAKKASYATAEYCNNRSYVFDNFESNPRIKPLIVRNKPKGTVYLAGPFFTFAQRWLIDRIRKDLKEMGLDVFSPLHDVGYGDPKEVAIKDIRALESSSLIFAVLDGLDAGTLFETGYAASRNIPIIGFVQNENADSLIMLKGADCEFIDDLTTAIYKTYWKMSEDE